MAEVVIRENVGNVIKIDGICYELKEETQDNVTHSIAQIDSVYDNCADCESSSSSLSSSSISNSSSSTSVSLSSSSISFSLSSSSISNSSSSVSSSLSSISSSSSSLSLSSSSVSYSSSSVSASDSSSSTSTVDLPPVVSSSSSSSSSSCSSSLSISSSSSLSSSSISSSNSLSNSTSSSSSGSAGGATPVDCNSCDPPLVSTYTATLTDYATLSANFNFVDGTHTLVEGEAFNCTWSKVFINPNGDGLNWYVDLSYSTYSEWAVEVYDQDYNDYWLTVCTEAPARAYCDGPISTEVYKDGGTAPEVIVSA